MHSVKRCPIVICITVQISVNPSTKLKVQISFNSINTSLLFSSFYPQHIGNQTKFTAEKKEKLICKMAEKPKIAILGAGIHVRTQYIPRLQELADVVVLKAIWDLTEESIKPAIELARNFSPQVECKWGDSGLDEIIQDTTIVGVAVVLAAQFQVEFSLRMLKAGKHVLQEKPASESTIKAEIALSDYKSLCKNIPRQLIWAVAENYRFEPVFLESRKFVSEIGDMMNIQVIVEGYVTSSNPFFPSTWRRKLNGGFILDMGVHFIAGLRMITGSEISTVSAITRYVNTTLPPPDNICALFQLENGCPGVFVLAVCSPSPRVYWRVDGSKGVVQIERSFEENRLGHEVLFTKSDGHSQKSFYPFSGVHEEIKCFVGNIVNVNSQDGGADYVAEPRSSYIEGVRDVAVIEAMLESSTKQGMPMPVKKF